MFNRTVTVRCVVDVHLPPAQVGVVLLGAVRAGTEAVTNSDARETTAFCSRRGGGTLLSRGPVVMAAFRGGRVFGSFNVGRTRGLVEYFVVTVVAVEL